MVITLTDDLKKDVIARELVNRIQNIRKDSGFEVTDKVKIKMQQNSVIQDAVTANIDYIKAETLTETLEFVDVLENGTEIEFDDLVTKISVSK